MSDRLKKPIAISRMVICLGLVLLAVYGVTYRSIVTSGLIMRGGRIVAGPVYAKQRSMQKSLEWFFWPVHQVDRLLRPSLWDAQISDVPEILRRKQ